MKLNFISSVLFFFLLLLTVFSSFSSSSFISDGVVESQTLVIGRNLLQTKKPCPVKFEFMNYTDITSRCKGPKYPAKKCCAAFKDFACPYADELNDLSTDCASTMFSYLNLYGKYPPGLFANKCKDSKDGIECPTLPPAASPSLPPALPLAVHPAQTPDINAATTASYRQLLTISAALLVFVKLL
ncbi:hypothetical protein AALP_AA1G317500 [Arabis alpina]|uniref:GPI-anchored protein LLG1-like domain-containing protein n=1 Tax=Arabis alpina TaxID=50452 RepID=A0A087HRZ8_ARAAL|nr:hypothetical protein AALP_AA1G317500 [Arabis alpina]